MTVLPVGYFPLQSFHDFNPTWYVSPATDWTWNGVHNPDSVRGVQPLGRGDRKSLGSGREDEINTPANHGLSSGCARLAVA